eukprot:jgi/Picre1/31642/NNA_006993.t1
MAVEAGKKLEAEGKKVRVVSMPCWELFEEQPQSYKDSVLTPGVAKVSVEAGSTFGWQKYVGEKGLPLELMTSVHLPQLQSCMRSTESLLMPSSMLQNRFAKPL